MRSQIYIHKISLPDYLFSLERVNFHDRKMPRNSRNSLPDNRCSLYRQYSALQKHYRPVGEIIEDVQRRFDSSLLTKAHHIHQHHLIRPMTASTSTFHVLGARHRRIFHAAITFATHKRKTHEGYDKILQPIQKQSHI